LLQVRVGEQLAGGLESRMKIQDLCVTTQIPRFSELGVHTESLIKRRRRLWWLLRKHTSLIEKLMDGRETSIDDLSRVLADDGTRVAYFRL
jgi:hypothetical protein